MTAFQIMILSGLGEPLIPTGGSEASRLKSRIRRRLAAVDLDVSAVIPRCDRNSLGESERPGDCDLPYWLIGMGERERIYTEGSR